MRGLDQARRVGALLLLLATGACGSGGGGGGITPPGADTGPTDTSQTTTTAVLGVVTDPAGAPLQGVTVRAGAQTTISGPGGQFQLNVPAQGTTVLVFEQPPKAPAYRAVSPKGAAQVTVSAVLIPPTATGQVDVQQGPATLQVPGGVSLKFPMGSLVLPTGQPPQEPVQAVVTVILPGQVGQLDTPVPMMALDQGELTPLVTYGMVDVQLSTAAGIKVQVAPGQTVEARLPAGPTDPDSAGLFYGDPAVGLWVLEGAASRIGSEWIMQLPHLSWWNVDAFYKVPVDQQACLTLRSVRANGTPLPGVELKSKWGAGYTIAGTTDPPTGTLCHAQFPKGETITIDWKAYLKPFAKQVSGSTTVTVSGPKVKCGDPACQMVDLVVMCSENAHCGGTDECQQGLCVPKGTVPGLDTTGGDTGGSDAVLPPCVPQCAPGQCTDDGCGKPCIECPKGQTCSPDSKTCTACVPDCSGQVCGSDGCGGSCGLCPPGQSCDNAKCVAPCSFCPTGACNAFDFEDGTLDGWDVAGDVAVIPLLGQTGPAQGSKMLRLSTGIAQPTPSKAQKALCASPGVTKLRFRWKLYSEEFKEFCGSQYQDTFTVAVLVGSERTEVFERTVDELCPVGEKGCTKCGGQFVGLDKSDVHFDKGDTWTTPWQQAEVALPAGAWTATLLLEVTDVGDSIYDTVVLIDDLVLVP